MNLASEERPLSNRTTPQKNDRAEVLFLRGWPGSKTHHVAEERR